MTIVRNEAPASQYEVHLRREHASRLAHGGWILFADADEMVETPSHLEAVTSYCNEHGYSAVVGQMLDMFSDDPFSRLSGLSYQEAISALDRYSISAVESLNYHDDTVQFSYFLRSNVCADPLLTLKAGGIRSELFGERPFLSKHSLVRNLPGVTLMSHPHSASNVRVADVSLLLRHYKLAGDWVSRDRRSVSEKHWKHGDDAKRLAAIRSGDDFRLQIPTSERWGGVPALQDAFLYSSPAFRVHTLDTPV